MRVLLGLALLFLAIGALRVLARSLRASRSASDRQARSPDSLHSEAMVRCHHCAAYFPASEAVPGQADKMFCSVEHRKRGSAH